MNCVICNNKINGIGANPYPISYFGECCNTCDNNKVIPARVLEQHYISKYGQSVGSHCITNLIHLGIKVERTVELCKQANKGGQ